MWERFSYYGMRAILLLYMLNALLYNTTFASTIYGYYTGLVYFTPLIGGYIADKYWGNRKSIITGGLLMALGQFSLAASSYLYVPPVIQGASYSSFIFTNQELFFLLGLFLLIMGNGFFKPNISSMVGFLYSKNDEKKDAAFTIFYMGINLGALLSPLIVGGLGDTGNPADYMYGFLAAGIGMIIGLAIFILYKKRYIVTPEGETVGSTPSHAIKCKENSEGPLTSIEKQRIAVIFILSFFSVFFFIAFEQSGISLTILAEQHVDRVITSLNNFQYSASWFQTINPLAILILAPLFASLWPRLRKKGFEPSIPSKMGIGLIVLSIGFLTLLPAAKLLDAGSQIISPLWLVLAYVIFTMGELCLSPIGLSMVSKLSPVKFTCCLMATWFLASSMAGVLSGYLGSLCPSPTRSITTLAGIPIDGFTSFFMIFIIMSAAAGVILLLLRNKLLKMMHGIQ